MWPLNKLKADLLDRFKRKIAYEEDYRGCLLKRNMMMEENGELYAAYLDLSLMYLIIICR